MTINERIEAFVALGDHLTKLDTEIREELQLKAGSENPWFTPANVDAAINGIAHFLKSETLKSWVSQYEIKDQNKVVGVVMAGNIPLVGFHDMLCVLISGNTLKVKLSSKDTALMQYVMDQLITINQEFENKLVKADQLKDIDAIIATGSDNSSRYFDYYFSKYPHIIRKNRTSVAVIDKDLEVKDVMPLGHDIFQYYGLGCRNVSKLFVPEGYDFHPFYQAMENFDDVKQHHKYSNNYDYNKSIYLVNKQKHLDNGFLILKPDEAMVSPISVLFYEEYSDASDLNQKLSGAKDKIQCIVSYQGKLEGSHPFGQAQLPKIDDYADGVDTMEFLTSL